LIEEYTSYLKKSSGFFLNEGVKDTFHSQKTRQLYSQRYGFNCMFYFCVHSKSYDNFYDVFTDKDLNVLRTYAKHIYYQYFTKEDLKKILERDISDIEYVDFFMRLQRGKNLLEKINLESKKIINNKIIQNRKNDYFSILATPNRSELSIDNYQLSVLYAMPIVNEINGEIVTKIYSSNNIYYIMGDDVYRIGSYERQKAPILSTNRQITDVKIPIQAIGIDPNTKKMIQDEKVVFLKMVKFLLFIRNINN
jgi:hypothetical protein